MEYVKLRPKDLNVLIDITQEIIDYKYKALSKSNWIIFERDYLPSLIKAFKENQFKIIISDDNILVWFVDQMVWSRRISPGVPLKEGVPLIDTELGERASEICRAARRGQQYYNTWSAATTYRDLFTD